MSKLSFVGDLTVDVYPKLNRRRLGGSSLTCALWAKKLGAKATILAAVGNDSFPLSLRGGAQSATTWQSLPEEYLKTCKKTGINSDYIKILPGKTSSIEIFLDKNGERTWGKWNPGALAKYHLEKPEYDFLKTQDAVAMPVYAKTKHLLTELLSLRFSSNTPIPPKPLICVDFDDLSQFEKSTKIIEDHLPYIDIVIVGLDMVSDAKIMRKLQTLSCHCEESRRTSGRRGNLLPKQEDSHGRLRRPRNDIKRSKLFVVTLNKNGSIAFLGKQVFRQKAIPPSGKVINSTGAGDAFLAGFLAEYLKFPNIQNSLRQGTKTATLAIQHIGAY